MLERKKSGPGSWGGKPEELPELEAAKRELLVASPVCLKQKLSLKGPHQEIGYDFL